MAGPADTASGSFADFLRRYRALFPAPAPAPAPEAGVRRRREFGWRPLTPAAGPQDGGGWRSDRRASGLGAEPDSVDPPPPGLSYPSPAYPDPDPDTEDLRARHRHRDEDDLPAAEPDTDDSDTDLEEEVLRAPVVPPARTKPLASQRVDEAWVRAGLLQLIGRGKLRAQLRRDVREKVTKEEISGALRPVFATNFTARFTADSCGALHGFRAGVEDRLEGACWYCQDRVSQQPTQRRGKCMQICQVTRLDVACKRRGEGRSFRVQGVAEPVEGRRFGRACNDTCREEWELLLQYGAAARLRAQLGSPGGVGRSRPVPGSVSVRQETRCADRFQLRYRLCYPAGSWAQRAVVDLEHAPWWWLLLGILAALSVLCCLCCCCYYRVLQIPQIAARVNGWLRRRRLKWRVAGGVERTESGHYRRPSMVATGAHGKQSREDIKRTVERWRRRRAAEGRRDGAPRSLYSAVQMVHPPPTAAPAPAPGDDTSVFSEQIDTDHSG